MNRERFEQARRIFEAASDLPRPERAAFVRERCGEDAELWAHVNRLLRFSESESVPLDARPLEASFRSALEAASAAPASIGSFRVIRLIGRGGMGDVYEAEQEHPRRRVAIKVLRAGLLTPQLLRRFEMEAQVLGRLQHPGIACIHEAGVRRVNGEDQPYIAMELVRGRPLDTFAETQPDPRVRLELFARICEAMDHAHSAGVVHRDLKPSNILVDEARNPRIVDFGVARLLDTADSVRSMHTAAGQLVGTLAYMSPEQISGAAHEVDARSDVYSLGVILFELLSGRLPLDVRGRSLPEVARMIREHDPTTLSALDAAFRGDLDTITAKALEKDPARRYPTAGDLAADIRRFLRDEPIAARPPTAAYQLKKFARRHRELVAGLAATFAVLLIGLVSVSWLALREARQRKIAEARAVQARWESYRNCIAAADRSLRLNDAPRAVQLLDSAPEIVRGWEWRYLRRLADQSVLTIQASSSAVNSAVMAGGAIWAASADGVIARFDPKDGHKLSSQQVYSEEAAMLSVAPDGRRCISCSADGEVAAWDTQGTLLWRFKGSGLTHEQGFLPDGTRLAVPLDRRVGFIDMESGREVDSFPLPVQNADRPAIDRTGRFLLCRLGPVIVCFDLTTREEKWRLEGSNASFSGDGSRAFTYSGGPIGLIEIEVATGRTILRRDDQGGLPFGSSGTWIPTLAGSSIALLDPDTGEAQLTLPGHLAAARWTWLVPGSSTLITSAADGTVKLWDTRTAGEAFTISPSNDAVFAGAVSPDARRAATVGWGCVKLWDLESGAEVWTAFPVSRELHAAAFSPDGKRLAVAGFDRLVAILDAADGRTLGESPALGVPIHQVAWIDDDTVAAVGDDHRWYTLEARSGSPKDHASADEPAINVIATCRGGHLCAATGPRGLVSIGALGASESLDAGEGSAGSALAFDFRGTYLARGAEDGSVSLWDCKSRSKLWDVGAVGGGAVTALAFAPGGDRLAAGFAGGAVHLLDAATGDTLLELRAAPGAANDLGFTPDGSRLVALSIQPGGCRLFEVAPSFEDLVARTLQTRARTLVDALAPRLHFADDIAVAAAAAPGETDEVRSLAAKLAKVRGDHANYLNSQAWAVARFPNRTPEDYALAIAKAEHACRVMPESHAYRNTLGVALLRAGRLDEAIAALSACLAMPRDEGAPPHPADLLPLAIAWANAGKPDVARSQLRAARESLEHYAPDPEYDWLTSEAEAAIAKSDSSR